MADGSGKASAIHTLTRESEAARGLLANMRDILADDDELAAATIEGETNLIEAITAGVTRYAELGVLLDGAEALASALKARTARFERQRELLKEALAVAMQSGEMRKLELPLGTISLKAVPKSVVVTDEAAIPAAYWKARDPVLDKKAIGDALKAGTPVAGAEMSNGGETIQIRLK